MSYKNKNKILTVEIEGLSSKGNGIGTHESKVIEVPFTMKGDLIEARVNRKRRGALQASLETMEQPAPERVEPRCRHFGTCGGCRWQHIPYDLQLKEKESRIRAFFPDHLDETAPIISCSPPWEYRNKMEFTFSSDKSGEHYLGLMMEGGRGKVLNLTECHLCSPWFLEVLGRVKSWWDHSELDAYHHFRDTGSLRTLTLREGAYTGEKMAILTVSGNPDFALNRTQLNQFIEAVGGSCSIYLRIHQIMKGKPTQFYEMHLAGPAAIREQMTLFGKPMTFLISPKSFFQPNTKQAEKLYQKALELAEVKAGDVVYDLYCGTGTLGLCASQMAQKVIGIEIMPEAILDAKENAKLNDCRNIEFFQGDVGDVLKQLSHSPDVAFVDPPRVGLSAQAISHLRELSPPRIVYISCNPKTQAENIGELQSFGYRIAAIQPVDQFPQTVHIENIVVLEKGQNEI